MNHNLGVRARMPGFSPMPMNHVLVDDAMATLARFIRQREAVAETGNARSLLPRLKALRISTGKQMLFPDYLGQGLLCAGTLTSLVVDCDGSDYGPGTSGAYGKLSEILPTLQSTWPNLLEVRLPNTVLKVHGKEDTKFAGNLDVWLSGLAQLRSLSTVLPTQPHSIKTFSQLTNLCDLYLTDSRKTPALVDAKISLPCFPSLQKLSLTACDLRSPIAFLSALGDSSQLLHTLIIRSSHGAHDPSSCQCVPDIFKATSRLPTIECLTIDANHNSLRNPSHTLSGELMAHLFSLRSLKQLKLTRFTRSLLTDDDLRAAATAWPGLETILLCCYRPEEETIIPSSTTVVGVQELYNSCPNLKTMRLSINDDIPATDGILDLPMTTSHSPMQQLSLCFHADAGGLKQGSSEYMAMLVAVMFPGLASLDSCAVPPIWKKTLLRNWDKYRNMELADVVALLKPFLDCVGGGERQ
ncbi:hypothetical protein BC629DRAFT_535126 [Irpex lacteus]|nr:hypothetical protein BC629DRAFT_535126 [Irpex lacteus]